MLKKVREDKETREEKKRSEEGKPEDYGKERKRRTGKLERRQSKKTREKAEQKI